MQKSSNCEIQKESVTVSAQPFTVCSQRGDCIEQHRPALASNNLVSLTDVITDRFLCTGGSQKYKDYITCKGIFIFIYF